MFVKPIPQAMMNFIQYMQFVASVSLLGYTCTVVTWTVKFLMSGITDVNDDSALFWLIYIRLSCWIDLYTSTIPYNIASIIHVFSIVVKYTDYLCSFAALYN